MGPAETIAAIATPPGEGGIGIIRLSGPRAAEGLQPLVEITPDQLEPRKAQLCNYRLPTDNQVIDQGLVTYFPAPNSYTGEDVIECSCHGSPLLLQELLSALLDQPEVRLAEPGEFTRRAFTNGKLDLAEASAVGELISARSEAALKSSARQLTGELSKVVEQLRNTIINARAEVEANLDFSDQDSITNLSERDLANSLEKALNRVEKLVKEGKIGELLTSGCQLAIVGRPNVGKSSVFNLLLKKDRAIVTAQPGTTRDTLREEITLNGIPITLHDTAGIHQSPAEIEAQGVERSETAIKNADLALFLLDAQTSLTEEDLHIKKLLDRAKTPFLIAVNKIDLPGQITDSAVVSALGKKVKCRVSVKENKGIEKLEKKIVEKISGEKVETINPLVTQTRHLQALKRVRKFLAQALQKISEGDEPALIAEDLRLAAEEMNKITGEITTDTVLDQIFSNFCIGK